MPTPDFSHPNLPSRNEECRLLQVEYQELLHLEAECTTALEQALYSGDKKRLRSAKVAYLTALARLAEQLNPFEKLINLQEQYQAKLALFRKLELLEHLPDGREAIRDINDQLRPVISYQEVVQRFKDKAELCKGKIGQGFVRLKLTPFGLSIDRLIEKKKQLLLQHFAEGRLFYTKADPNDSTEALIPITAAEFDASNPLWVWDKYRGADKSGGLVYYPESFSATPGGQIKAELIVEAGVWDIGLMEDLPNIPRGGHGQTVGARPQLDTTGTSIRAFIAPGETVPTPREYLQALQTDPTYQHESGLTPEDQLIYDMEFLEATNQVMDDYKGQGSVSYQLGAYFVADGIVPVACWDRNNRQARLGGVAPDFRDDRCGVRSSGGV